ncbi:Cold-responsive protein kinase 1 [Bienertia sinuspersici]
MRLIPSLSSLIKKEEDGYELWLLTFSQKKKGPARPLSEVEGQLLENIRHFSYDELSLATSDFSSRNKIGRGGFGIVYKGILKSGLQVAVKTLSAESKQGLREFLTEINTISNVKHPNLVELIGCCAEGNNRYTSDRSKLNWERRSAICLGTARALAFLHEELVPHIVHRDVKASNILLDKDFLPKIGDFGLAKLFPDDITHISTRIAGTTGYLAPEYALGGHLTMKADVYSFGVLILEIVSGQSSSKSNWGGSSKYLWNGYVKTAWELYEEGRLLELVDSEMGEYPEDAVIRYMKCFFCTPSSWCNLIGEEHEAASDWLHAYVTARSLEAAWQLYEEGRLLELVDSEMGEYPEDMVNRYMIIAFFCTQAGASRRPLMSQVIDMLSTKTRLNEKQLSAPGFFPDGGVGVKEKTSAGSSSLQFSSAPVTITEVSPR